MLRIALTTAGVLLVMFKMVAQPLNIGDKVPDFHIGKIINYPQENLRFSDIKARLVILDFWTDGCPSCIEAMPKMDALQKKFGSKIFILPANFQEEERIKRFWAKNNYLKSVSLPTVVGDTLLKKYTPWTGGMGFHVWILDGRIYAYPSTSFANEKNIAEVLAGVPKKWNLALNARKQYDVNKSLLDNGDCQTNKSKIYFSVVVPFKPLFKDNLHNNFADSGRTSTRIQIINSPILGLYNIANQFIFGMKKLSNLKRLIPNDSRFIEPIENDFADEWISNNSFCYEAIFPGKISEQDVGRYMLTDFDRFFALNGRIEKRKEDYLILSLKRGTVKIKDNTNKNYLTALKEHEKVRSEFPYPSPELGEFRKSIRGKELDRWRLVTSTSMLSELVNEKIDRKIDVVDNTNYEKEFQITMPLPVGKRMTLSELQNIVSDYGFELKKGGVREVDVFVLTDAVSSSTIKTSRK